MRTGGVMVPGLASYGVTGSQRVARTASKDSTGGAAGRGADGGPAAIARVVAAATDPGRPMPVADRLRESRRSPNRVVVVTLRRPFGGSSGTVQGGRLSAMRRCLALRPAPARARPSKLLVSNLAPQYEVTAKCGQIQLTEGGALVPREAANVAGCSTSSGNLPRRRLARARVLIATFACSRFSGAGF
jgi:hypothetical protein